MPKNLVHVCSKCDAQFPRWSGRCESCGSWGTISKEAISINPIKNSLTTNSKTHIDIKSFAQLTKNKKIADHHATNDPIIDQILSGGLVNGSVTLLAGEPGMGKSTLLSQTALKLAKNNKKILYVAGEESPQQINLRLQRFQKQVPKNLFYLLETDTDSIINAIKNTKFDLVIIDSIQSIHHPEINSDAGSTQQIKASASILTQAAKQEDTSLFIIGQVTKDGDIAGPRILEHVVDTVLWLEGDKTHRFRILRVIKNRFGTTDETVLLDMTKNGLEIIKDPSQTLLENRPLTSPGSSIGCILEGRRPILIELQALVSPSGYSQPTRRTTGLDNSRLSMLLAVLTHHGHLSVYDKDVYTNSTGGLTIKDPATDLTICLAIASAVKNKPINQQTASFGEVGLTGELRPVALSELRIKELVRLGFNTIICPPLKKEIKIPNTTIIPCQTITQAIKHI